MRWQIVRVDNGRDIEAKKKGKKIKLYFSLCFLNKYYSLTCEGTQCEKFSNVKVF